MSRKSVGILAFRAASTIVWISAQCAAQEQAAHGHTAAAHSGPFKEHFDADFVASDIFRSGTLVLPLYRGLSFEGNYYGTADFNLGFTGATWAFHWKGLLIAPGFGVTFGGQGLNAANPTFAFRLHYQKKWFVAQVMTLQGSREVRIEEHHGNHSRSTEEHPAEPEYIHPLFSDGNHVSAQWKRFTIGGTWEHIQFREGEEWKYGGRLAFRVLPRMSLLFFALTPGKTEFRGGILIHGPQAEFE